MPSRTRSANSAGATCSIGSSSGRVRRSPIRPQRAPQEPAQNPPVQILERRLARAVVAAGELGDVVRDVLRAEVGDEILRQVHGKRQIVARVHEERLPVPYPLEVPARADWLPHPAKDLEIDVAVEAVAD